LHAHSHTYTNLIAELSKDCLIPIDHWHLKNAIWPKQLGDYLYNSIKEHPEAALHSFTKEDFEYHCQKTYDALAQFPEHIDYFKRYFKNTKSIAKYEIMKIRGSLCTVASSNAEATHSSNESHHPTKLMGIMSPEEHLLQLIKRNDEWIRRDKTEHGELEFQRAHLGSRMAEDSIEHQALHTLA